jgi:heptosyltransferase-2
MKVLVIETAFPGDVVLSLALAEELKRLDPDTSITFLVRPDVADLIRCAPSVDHVIAFDKHGTDSGMRGLERMAEQLNREAFDTLFSLHESERTSRLIELVIAKSKVGFDSLHTVASLTHVVKDTKSRSRTARAISLLEPLYSNINYSTLPKLVVPNPKVPTGMNSDSTVVLAPGSVWPTKKWGVLKFAELARALVARGVKVVLIGTLADTEAGEKILGIAQSDVVTNLIGKTSLVEAASVIASADVVVANDSAPTHIATALGTKSVVLFGPTLPSFGFAPPVELGIVVEVLDLWCRPCSPHGSDECPIHTHECMTSIRVKQVYDTVIEILLARSLAA